MLFVTSLRKPKFTVGTAQWVASLGTDQNIVFLSAAGRVILHKWHQRQFCVGKPFVHM